MKKRWIPTSGLIVTTALVLNFGFDAGTNAATFPSQTKGLPAMRDAHTHYKVVELPTLGGLEDFANWINDHGWVTGAADLPGGHREHAFLWQNNEILDLGTLGGSNSLAWGVNDAGEIGGSSETSVNDPNEENFCAFYIDGKLEHSKRTCLGFVWSHGALTTLPTLGGNNGSVTGANDRGQFVGDAENGTIDRTCVPPQILDFEGVIWGPLGHAQTLPPLAGDPISAALGINDAGQAVGGSGVCGQGTASSVHAVLWHGGTVTNLGGFGGKANNVAFDINNRGQVVGFSDLRGDTTAHAFLWQDGALRDLGTLEGDVASFAFGINDSGQIVGQSCDARSNCRAFIWQDGVMTDLNTVAPGSASYLELAESINKNGEITGIAYDPATGGIPAFVAIPQRDGLDARPRSRPVLPADVRDRIQQMASRGRFGAPSFSLFVKP